MSKSKLLVWTCILAMVGGGVAWWYGAFDPPLSSDPAVAEVQRLQQAIDEAAPGEEQQAIREYQAKAKQLDPLQQIEVHADLLREAMAEREAELQAFFAQSEADQIKELDAEIDKLEESRRKHQGNRPKATLPKEPPKKSNVTGKTVIDLTTPLCRALTLEYHKKLVGRMKQRGINH